MKHYPYFETRTYNIPMIYYGGRAVIDTRSYQKYAQNVVIPPNTQPKPIQKRQVNLELQIQRLSDLIELAHKVDIDYKLTPDVEYNIDLAMIKKLLPEMVNLNNMIGQEGIKTQIANMILYFSLHLNMANDDLMHTVIDGAPGTGKTEFAQKIAKIYLKLGILKRDIFKKVKRSDLIAGYLGQTALKTEEVIDEVRGGVLFIDEAYSLGNNDGKESKDSFSKECIDILNQSLTEMRDNPDDYFILMIAGYKEDLKNSFFACNDGLERRFTIHFTMEPYSSQELIEIFKKKTCEAGWEIDVDAMTIEFMEKNKQYFKYAGGDMETLFVKCKIAHSKNLINGKNKKKRVLNELDISDGLDIFVKNPIVGERKPEDDRNASWRTIYN
jgi:Holliday junction resolvasome RuvABC ATP-dependent DNA helicase subunit